MVNLRVVLLGCMHFDDMFRWVILRIGGFSNILMFTMSRVGYLFAIRDFKKAFKDFFYSY